MQKYVVNLESETSRMKLNVTAKTDDDATESGFKKLQIQGLDRAKYKLKQLQRIM